MFKAFDGTLGFFLVNVRSELLSIAGSREQGNKGSQVRLEPLSVSDAEEDEQLVLLGQAGPGIIRINPKLENRVGYRLARCLPGCYSCWGVPFERLGQFASSCSCSRRNLWWGGMEGFFIEFKLHHTVANDLKSGDVETQEHPSVRHQ